MTWTPSSVVKEFVGLGSEVEGVVCLRFRAIVVWCTGWFVDDQEAVELLDGE